MFEMQRNNSSVKKNFMYQSIYEILIIILPLITSPYIARVLGAEQIGIYSYTYAIANYFVLFACLGVKNYGNRTIASVRDNQDELNKAFSNIYAVMILFAAIASVVYIAYVLVFSEYKTIAFIQFIYVLSCFFDINWFFFGIEKFKLTVTRNSIVKIGIVLATFIFVHDKDDLGIYCFIIAFGYFLGQSLVWAFLKNYVSFVRPTWTEMKTHIKPLFVLFIPVLAVSLYKYMDKIMLGNFSTKTQLGFYENAEKAINIPTSFISAFGTVMLPKMSNMAVSEGIDKVKSYIERSSELIMCLAVALSFGIAGVGKNFSVIFWGSEFEPCGEIIMALAITVPFISYANVIRTQYLIPQKKDKSYIVSVFAGAGVNIVANLLFIPKFQAVGAAYGTILAEITVCVLQAIFVRKELPVLLYVRKALYFLLAGILMFIVVQLIGNLGVHIYILLLQVVGGALFYGILCLIYFMITKNETVLQMINSLLRKIHLKNKDV